MEVWHQINQGIGDFLIQDVAAEALGVIKRGISQYNKFDYPATYMLLRVEDDIKAGDVVFINNGSSVSSIYNRQSNIGIAIVDAKAGYATHILYTGVAKVNTDTANVLNDYCYLKLPNLVVNEQQDNQILGANFIDTNTIFIKE